MILKGLRLHYYCKCSTSSRREELHYITWQPREFLNGLHWCLLFFCICGIKIWQPAYERTLPVNRSIKQLWGYYYVSLWETLLNNFFFFGPGCQILRTSLKEESERPTSSTDSGLGHTVLQPLSSSYLNSLNLRPWLVFRGHRLSDICPALSEEALSKTLVSLG